MVRIIFGNCHSPPGDEARRDVMIVPLAPQKGVLLERGSDGMRKVCMEYVKIVKPQNATWYFRRATLGRQDYTAREAKTTQKKADDTMMAPSCGKR